MAPFRDLLKPTQAHGKSVYWDDELQRIFEETKLKLCDLVEKGLSFYDVHKQTAVVTELVSVLLFAKNIVNALMISLLQNFVVQRGALKIMRKIFAQLKERPWLLIGLYNKAGCIYWVAISFRSLLIKKTTGQMFWQ